MAEDKDDVIRKMAALREGFKAGLDDRLRDLEAALDGLTPDGNADQTARTLETLHGLCHKLRGAAGTFGFAALSEIAGQLDDLTKALLDQGRSLDDGEREALWRLLSSLKAASVGQEGLSISDAAAWESLVTAREADGEVSMTVILVDDDEAFLELVRNQLSHFGFDVLALADHAELRNAVAATPPAAVIIRLESGRKGLREEELDIGELIGNSLAAFAGGAEGPALECDISQDLPRLSPWTRKRC
jgi:HPt (histidine-containing phosphotransfer) domain-containing protein